MWLSFSIGSVIAWSIPIVLDSVLVKNFENDPFILMWTQSCISMVILIIASFFVPFKSAWIPWLVLTSIIAYVGDIVLFHALDRVEASVINIAWAFMAIVLSIVGFYFFGESWSISQTIGVVCILCGVCFLSYWHHHIGWTAIGLIVAIGLLYAPSNAMQKAALFHGEILYTTIFWQLASRECLSFLFPWCLPSFRRKIGPFLFKVSSLHYWGLSFMVIVTYFSGMYLLAEAYKVGPISLVAVVGNIQTFTVLFFAWIIWKLFPRFASKEFFDGQTVLVKLSTFLIVFTGLGLLAIS